MVQAEAWDILRGGPFCLSSEGVEREYRLYRHAWTRAARYHEIRLCPFRYMQSIMSFRPFVSSAP
jgi:hypothetical protein